MSYQSHLKEDLLQNWVGGGKMPGSMAGVLPKKVDESRLKICRCGLAVISVEGEKWLAEMGGGFGVNYLGLAANVDPKRCDGREGCVRKEAK